MIKRYNQFVKERINENVDMEEQDMEQVLPFDSDEEEFDSDEEEFDSDEEEFMDEEDEEEGFDIYKTKMEELAKLLGVEVDETNKISFEGKEIIFPSETEMYHVDKKKFKTAQEVVDYLKK